MTDALPATHSDPLPDLLARYGAGELPALPKLDAVARAMLHHRSVRAYAPTPLAPGTLELLVAAAQSAPTSSNMQSWSVVAVEDPARKARLSRLAQDQAFIRQAPLFLCWIADLSRLERVGAAIGGRLEGLAFLETFMVAIIDAALAAQNAVVAAESLGLGTCYVGALRNHPEEVARELSLPPSALAVFGLAVGHAAQGAAGAVKPRLPQSVVLHRERYEAPAAEAEAVAAYDQALAAFGTAQGQGATAWTARVQARLGHISGLGGRDRMRAALAALGFPLR